MPIHDIDYLKEESRQLLNDVWGGTHRNWEEDGDYYEGRITIEVPEWISDNQKIVPASGNNKINKAADQFITSETVVKRPPIGKGESAQKKAEMLSKWATLAARGLNRFSMVPPYKTFGKHLALYGYANKYGPIWDDALWPLNPSKRRKDYDKLMDKRADSLKQIYPFVVQVPHPSKILLDPAEMKQPTFGYLRNRRARKHLWNTYPDKASDLQGRPYDEVDVLTYWSLDQHVVIVDSADHPIIIDEKENPYGFVPFSQAFLGLGRDTEYEDTDALSSMCVGFLRRIYSQMRAEALQATSINHLIFRMAFQHVLTSMDAQEFNELYGSQMVIGGLGDDISKAVRWEDVPNVPAWFFQFWGSIKGDIEAGTFGEILGGAKLPGVETASQHAQITSKARQVFNNPIQQINHVASLDVGNMAKLVEVYKDPVTMRGTINGVMNDFTVTGEDFQGNYVFDADIEASDPMEQTARLETLMSLRGAPGPYGSPGAIDYKTFLENMPPMLTTSQDELMERTLAEPGIQQAMGNPQIQAMIFAEVQKMWSEKMGMPPTPQGAPPMGPEGAPPMGPEEGLPPIGPEEDMPMGPEEGMPMGPPMGPPMGSPMGPGQNGGPMRG